MQMYICFAIVALPSSARPSQHRARQLVHYDNVPIAVQGSYTPPPLPSPQQRQQQRQQHDSQHLQHKWHQQQQQLQQ